MQIFDDLFSRGLINFDLLRSCDFIYWLFNLFEIKIWDGFNLVPRHIIIMLWRRKSCLYFWTKISFHPHVLKACTLMPEKKLNNRASLCVSIKNRDFRCINPLFFAAFRIFQDIFLDFQWKTGHENIIFCFEKEYWYCKPYGKIRRYFILSFLKEYVWKNFII